MNWYLIVFIVAAFLLGWAIGLLVGTSHGRAAAVNEYQQLAAQQAWSNYFNQFKGGKNEQASEE